MSSSNCCRWLTILGTTHEALGIFQGSARICLGRSDDDTEEGLVLDVQAGDVLVIPAGVVHLALEHSEDYRMVGAYPAGSPSWDMCYGRSEQECVQKTIAIKKVAVPPMDPVTGEKIWT